MCCSNQCVCTPPITYNQQRCWLFVIYAAYGRSKHRIWLELRWDTTLWSRDVDQHTYSHTACMHTSHNIHPPGGADSTISAKYDRSKHGIWLELRWDTTLWSRNLDQHVCMHTPHNIQPPEEPDYLVFLPVMIDLNIWNHLGIKIRHDPLVKERSTTTSMYVHLP